MPKHQYYEARLLDNPADPQNSRWELLVDGEQPVEDQKPVTDNNYHACLEAALQVMLANEMDDRLDDLVIARVTVSYGRPSERWMTRLLAKLRKAMNIEETHEQQVCRER